MYMDLSRRQEVSSRATAPTIRSGAQPNAQRPKPGRIENLPGWMESPEARRAEAFNVLGRKQVIDGFWTERCRYCSLFSTLPAHADTLAYGLTSSFADGGTIGRTLTLDNTAGFPQQ